MKTRRFSLQTVLEIRERAKELAEDALALAIQERDAAAQALDDALGTMDSIAKQLGREKFTAGERSRGWDGLVAQEDVCKKLSAELDNLRAKVEEKRAELSKASQDHELVLKLKAKWLKAQLAEQARIEERQLEEFVSARRFLSRSAEL